MEWIVILAAILLGVPAAAWFAQERLIFFPQPVVSTPDRNTLKLPDAYWAGVAGFLDARM